MGQKVNPVGFRLGVNRGWDSVWYAKKKDFGNYLIEDFKIRDYINKKLNISFISAKLAISKDYFTINKKEKWITNNFSRKVAHLRLNSSISITFQSSDGQNYVSINGKGILKEDLNLKTKYWKNEWTPFYNNIDTDCILVQIIPQSLELVSLSNDITGDPKTWKPKTIIIDD